MAKQSNDKGFVLSELLIVVAIITAFSLLVIVPIRIVIRDRPSSILSIQINAMYEMKRVKYDSRIWFNANGNVNRAGTYEVLGKTCIIQLGFGRYRCE
ncbi:prepilin-type N-terminal cleavage/methylation domain-containing protein [Erysipelothrix sp. HDW6C]|uniref:prepilin-type N-terminal cleavage/methylation domain-containing protein n=1 Tax=Erysipelothrix sp. HDW6C TaxID=2714930 RepID=UPI00140A8F3B|nr:prepilin-type N-terminal cleavage/methylation domain-containing protein [Erysipelothrix sp. HDW6C]QIK70153.1 prepilin-type N-terminal cleavage/methylation domain-containing protein [Erysipelothrix sp. HDW6C]